jgi:hypothetical protein
VRAFDDGRVIVYGTPWSGKTPCYRNLQMPVGAYVRLEQYPENVIRPKQALSLRIFYQWRFLLSCFIFIFQSIDYQYFRRLKHTTFMFHF